jgi:hypothetical protein
MAFKTPQYMGRKQGEAFLAKRLFIWKDDYMREGLERSDQYKEEVSQQRYLQGWEEAFEDPNWLTGERP